MYDEEWNIRQFVCSDVFVDGDTIVMDGNFGKGEYTTYERRLNNKGLIFYEKLCQKADWTSLGGFYIDGQITHEYLYNIDGRITQYATTRIWMGDTTSWAVVSCEWDSSRIISKKITEWDGR